MRKIYLKYNKIIDNLLLIIIISCISIFSAYMTVNAFSKDSIRFEDLIFKYFSGIASYKGTDFFAIIVFLGINLLNLYIFAGEFREELSIAYPYIFTRYGNKTKWMLKRCANLSIKIFIYLVLQIIIISIVGVFLSDFRFSLNQLGHIFIILVLNFLHILLWSSLSNILSLKLGDATAILISLSLIAVNLLSSTRVIDSPFTNKLLYIFPTANLMYYWHQDSIVSVFASEISQINDFKLIGSIIALLIYLLIIYIVFSILLETRDSIDLLDE